MVAELTPLPLFELASLVPGFRFDDGSGYMAHRTEDAKRDDKDDIYFRILVRLVAFYVKKNV